MGIINNENVEYEELTKLQRMAIFLIAVGPETASAVLSRFEDSAIESICREISKMGIVGEDLKFKAIDEFSKIIGNSYGSILGGMDFAQKTIALTGDDRLGMVDKLAPGGSNAELIREVKDMGAREIFNLLQDEQVQTIAYFLSNIHVSKTTQIVMMMPEDKRAQLIEFMGSMGEVPVEMMSKLSIVMRNKMRKAEESTMQEAGGVDMVAELLNGLGKEAAKDLLAKVEESNPELGAQISKKMFSFEDLLILSKEDLQRVTREIETNDLVLALKAASKDLTAALMSSVSKRAAESLKDELDMLGAVKVKVVEEAQERIIQVVKKLEEEGAIELGDGGGDVIE